MKKVVCFSFIAVLSILLLTGCGDSAKKSGASNIFKFNEKSVLVSVDLKDGWYVDFGENATYLFDQKPENDTKTIAYGVYVSKEDYDSDLEEYKSAKGYKEIKNGIFFEEETLSKYILKIDDDIYYMVIVEKGNDYKAKDVFDRFTVELSDF